MAQLTSTQNVAGFVRAEPNFEAVRFNEHYNIPGLTRRSIRASRAANGGDVSQIGTKRLVADPRSHQRIFDRNVAYFQPDLFDLCVDGAVAARVTTEFKLDGKWSDVDEAAVQEALIPKEELTDAEVLGVVREAMVLLLQELPAITPSVAAFVNTKASGSEAIAQVLRKVADIEADNEARTVAAGDRNEQIAAITADEITTLDLEALTILVQSTDDRTILKHLSALQGIQMAKISPKLAVAFEPFSSAIEKARVTKLNAIDPSVVNKLISEFSLLECGGVDADVKEMITIEVVFKQDLMPAYFNHFLDTEFTDDQIRILETNADDDVTKHLKGLVVRASVREDVDWIEHVNDGDDDAADVDMYEDVGDWKKVSIDEIDYLVALGRYSIAAVNCRSFKTSEASAYALAEYGVTRANIFEHKLYGNSNEVTMVDKAEWGALCAQKSETLLEACTDNIVGYTTLSTGHISYMKSGHHATANGLGNVYCKIRNALDNLQTIDISEVPEALALAVYYGTHPADMRAVAVFLRNLSAVGKLSFAIGRRITPQGPGTVSMYLLNLIIKQLAHIKFFEYLERQDELVQFNSMYASYAATAYLETPYANYMYGNSKSESVLLKQQVAPMFAYASSIGMAMPNSTFGFSVALSRDALSSANNAIVAKLEVESFVKSYKTYLRSFIRKGLERRAGGQGGNALLEDGSD